MRRYPLEPLAALVHLSPWTTLERAGITGSHAQDFIRRGMSARVADRVAVRHGFLPYEVWPEILDETISEHERKCEAPDCPVMFVPPPTGRGQKQQRYCSRACQIRTNMRRRYHSDPATRRRRIEGSRRYKHEVAELRRKRAS